MRVEKGKVRPPELGRVWLNSSPLSIRQLRGRALLVDFWDYACINCIRTLPYLQAWHERYWSKGLTVIGVHTPEFSFAQHESNVERGVRELGLTYPIVLDSDRQIWKAFANQYWPSKYLLDKEGYLRYAHFGEGAYAETEEAIRELLREINPVLSFPPMMEPVRAEDRPGATCYPVSDELYLGHGRGRIGNEGGFKLDTVSQYSFSGELQENRFYASGCWASTVEYLESVEEGEHILVLKYRAASVNLVMAAPRGAPREVMVHLDGRPLTPHERTSDTCFREVNGQPYSSVLVNHPRMYALADNRDFGTHVLELNCPAGVAAFAFTFTSCVDPSRAPLASGASSLSP